MKTIVLFDVMVLEVSLLNIYSKVGLVFFAVCILSLFYSILTKNKTNSPQIAMATFIIGMFLVISISNKIDHRERLTALKNKVISNQYLIVEGHVDNFKPMHPAGHEYESFILGGVKFYYSEYYQTLGYNKTYHNGGYVRQGMWLKISYIKNHLNENIIVKLEGKK